LNSVFIFFRTLSLFILGGLMFAGVVHTVKCIFKKHDIDLISEFVIIIIGMCIAVSWSVDLH
jgi:hypothetical protein